MAGTVKLYRILSILDIHYMINDFIIITTQQVTFKIYTNVSTNLHFTLRSFNSHSTVYW